MIHYSVIIPHYNLSSLLLRLIQTIPIRDDLEILIIDDKSDEAEFSKVLKISNTTPHIRIIQNQVNGGGGAARNRGISEALGKYLIFADADDFFLPSFNQLLNQYVDSDADIIFFNALSLDSTTYFPCDRANHLNKMFQLYQCNERKALLEFKYLFGEPWCKIIKRNLIEEYSVLFDEISIHNDTTFSYKLGYYAKDVIINSTVAYCLTERVNSVSKAISSDKEKLRIQVFAKKNRFLLDNKIGIVDPIFLIPLKRALKTHNLSLIKRYFSISKQNGINKYDILRILLKTVINKFKL